TLLLADDSVTIQRVIELTFADEDVQVIAVSDGDQAIARLDANPPDIVLADIGMPGKDGYEVAAHIKKSPKLSHIPVVLLTGAFEPVDQARADALKSLLAAEPARPAAAQLPAPPAWPPPAAPAPAASALAPPPAPAADDLVEQVTRRVLDRLSDRVVREKVSEIVSAVAERVVR